MAKPQIKIQVSEMSSMRVEKFEVRVIDTATGETVAHAVCYSKFGAIKTGKKYSRLYRKYGISMFTK